jgi:hypothetical protein
LIEIAPVPPLAPLSFYGYCCLKAVLFFLAGLLTPLTLREFGALGRGLVVAFVSSIMLEGLQSLIQHGHDFHLLDLTAKFLVVFAGFSVGIVARYERTFSLFHVYVRLADAIS